jgi:hypothetical protein
MACVDDHDLQVDAGTGIGRIALHPITGAAWPAS